MVDSMTYLFVEKEPSLTLIPSHRFIILPWELNLRQGNSLNQSIMTIIDSIMSLLMGNISIIIAKQLELQDCNGFV